MSARPLLVVLLTASFAAAEPPSRWPSFRGPHATGLADGSSLPDTWNVPKGQNVRWKTAIPGLGHASPVVWEGRVFVATAVSSDPKSEFKTDLGGSGKAAADMSKHSWRVLALDLKTGKVLWEKTAHEGIPKVKRHLKASHANATPATDGKHVVAFFASEGLYCYDLDGRELWKKDLGVIDAGAYDVPTLQWGSASSPVIHAGRVFVQCDQHQGSFLAAFDVATGKELWRVGRDEKPSWATPTIHEGPGRTELITSAPNFSRGYDPATGKELWKLGGHSAITTPTPFAARGLIYLADGYYRPRPGGIHAVKPGATGDLTLKAGEAANAGVAWSKAKGGPYMPTPIVYGEHLYVLRDRGMLVCYDAATGKDVYEETVGGRYSASPVAADGKVYLTSEAGDVLVVKAGPKFDLIAKNPIGEACLATPAIAGGLLLVRGQNTLYAIGR
jgi:outer membrane protein assembly factor BamB